LPQAINRLNQALKEREYLKVLDFDLAQEYREKSASKHDNRGTTSIFQKIKTETRGIRGVNNERKNQIDEIQLLIDYFKSSNELAREKAIITYAKLDQVRNAVSGKSELGKLCE